MTEPVKVDLVSANELDLKLYAGIEVLKTQQSEINRRLTKLEDRLEANLIDPTRVVELEDWRDELSKPTPWRDYVVQAIMWGVGITFLAAVGRFLGLEVVW